MHSVAGPVGCVDNCCVLEDDIEWVHAAGSEGSWARAGLGSASLAQAQSMKKSVREALCCSARAKSCTAAGQMQPLWADSIHQSFQIHCLCWKVVQTERPGSLGHSTSLQHTRRALGSSCWRVTGNLPHRPDTAV